MTRSRTSRQCSRQRYLGYSYFFIIMHIECQLAHLVYKPPSSSQRQCTTSSSSASTLVSKSKQSLRSHDVSVHSSPFSKPTSSPAPCVASKNANPCMALPPHALPSVKNAKCPPTTGLAKKFGPGKPPSPSVLCRSVKGRSGIANSQQMRLCGRAGKGSEILEQTYLCKFR